MMYMTSTEEASEHCWGGIVMLISHHDYHKEETAKLPATEEMNSAGGQREKHIRHVVFGIFYLFGFYHFNL